MKVYEDLLLSLLDFQCVTIACPDCKTRVTLDMKAGPQAMKIPGSFTPKECPGCRKGYDSAIAPGIDALQSAYAKLLPIQDKMTFSRERP